MKLKATDFIPMIVAVIINAYPVYMAFVVGDQGWGKAGWAFYFFTVPAAGGLFVVGGVLSLLLAWVRSRLFAFGTKTISDD